jgi:outer membrane protein
MRFLRRPIAAACLLALSTPVALADNLLGTYDLAAERDPQLAQASATRLATLEDKPIARSGYLPSVDLDAGATFNRTRRLGDSDTESFTLSATQILYSSTVSATIRAADASVAQANAEYIAAEQDLIVRVAQRYFDVLKAEDDLEFVRAEKQAIGRQLEQATKRYEVGLIAITDVHEAQAQYDLSVAREIAAENQLANALAQLRAITGQTPKDLQTLGENLDLVAPDPQDVDVWIDVALTNNPTFVAAQHQAEVARENINVQKAERYPVLSAVASHERGRFNGGLSRALPSTGEIDRTVADTVFGVQMQMSLFQGGAISARTRQAEYQYAASQEQVETSRREVERQTSDAYRAVLTSISRVKALGQAVVSNQSALRATEAGFEVGTRTIVDVLDAIRDLLLAERDFRAERYNYLLATLALQQAAGGLSLEDVEMVNAWLVPRTEGEIGAMVEETSRTAEQGAETPETPAP